MSVQNNFLLQIKLEDTNIEPKESIQVLVYVNGIYHTDLRISNQEEQQIQKKNNSSCQILVNYQDRLIFSLQQKQRSLGEQVLAVSEIQGQKDNNRICLKFTPPISPSKQSPKRQINKDKNQKQQNQIILLITEKEPLQTETKNQTQESFEATDQQKHESRQSVQCEQCSKAYNVSPQRQKFPKLEKVISDVLTLLDAVQTEQQKTSSFSPSRRSKLKQQSSELNRMYDTFAYYSQHWCKHCVFYHLKDDLKRLEKLKQDQSFVKQSRMRTTNSQYIQSQNLSSHHNYLKDTINDRASPSSVDQVSIKKKKKATDPDKIEDTFLEQIYSRLQQTTNQKEQKENTMEVSIKNMIEMLIHENLQVKDENTKLKQLIHRNNKKEEEKQLEQLREENNLLKQLVQKNGSKNIDDQNEKLKDENYKLRELLKLSTKKKESQMIEQMKQENQALQQKISNQQQYIEDQLMFHKPVQRNQNEEYTYQPKKIQNLSEDYVHQPMNNYATFQSFGDQGGFQTNYLQENIDINETAEIEKNKIKNLFKEKKKIMQELMNTMFQ